MDACGEDLGSLPRGGMLQGKMTVCKETLAYCPDGIAEEGSYRRGLLWLLALPETYPHLMHEPSPHKSRGEGTAAGAFPPSCYYQV